MNANEITELLDRLPGMCERAYKNRTTPDNADNLSPNAFLVSEEELDFLRASSVATPVLLGIVECVKDRQKRPGRGIGEAYPPDLVVRWLVDDALIRPDVQRMLGNGDYGFDAPPRASKSVKVRPVYQGRSPAPKIEEEEE